MTGSRLHGVRPGRMGKLIREAWKHLMRDTAKEWAPIQYRSQRDGPWWSPQRTSVGFLSAAILKIGGAAIEEYGMNKKNSCDLKGILEGQERPREAGVMCAHPLP